MKFLFKFSVVLWRHSHEILTRLRFFLRLHYNAVMGADSICKMLVGAAFPPRSNKQKKKKKKITHRRNSFVAFVWCHYSSSNPPNPHKVSCWSMMNDPCSFPLTVLPSLHLNMLERINIWLLELPNTVVAGRNYLCMSWIDPLKAMRWSAVDWLDAAELDRLIETNKKVMRWCDGYMETGPDDGLGLWSGDLISVGK